MESKNEEDLNLDNLSDHEKTMNDKKGDITQNQGIPEAKSSFQNKKIQNDELIKDADKIDPYDEKIESKYFYIYRTIF